MLKKSLIGLSIVLGATLMLSSCQSENRVDPNLVDQNNNNNHSSNNQNNNQTLSGDVAITSDSVLEVATPLVQLVR